MRDYLSGYLDVLPDNQKSKIQELIKSSTVALQGTIVNEDQYAELIREITDEHKKLTKEVPQIDRVDEKLYNQFFLSLQTDMNLMFLETDLVEQALNSYERLYDGVLGDLSKEINSVRERIDTLRLVAQSEDGLIVKSYDFSSNTGMETDRVKYAHLFQDRDGSIVGNIALQRGSDHSYIALGRDVEKDRLRDASGNTVALIKVTDQRGVPVLQTSYPIANAVDGSTSSYWGEVILADQPINVGIDSVPAGGVMVKFQITLPHPDIVSEISLIPFTTYPVDLVSVMYEEDTETFHLPKELIPSGKTYSSTGTMILQFPNVIAKRFTLILRQSNFVKNSYMVRETQMNKADLWDQISRREEEVTLSAPNGNPTITQSEVNKISGWDIYVQQMNKYNGDHVTWLDRLQKYNEWKVKADAYTAQYNQYVANINNLNRSYGTNYVADKNVIG